MPVKLFLSSGDFLFDKVNPFAASGGVFYRRLVNRIRKEQGIPSTWIGGCFPRE